MQLATSHEHDARGPATVGASLLRLSIGQRFGIALVFAAFLWTAVLWAMGWIAT
jgi:hypothetical protein